VFAIKSLRITRGQTVNIDPWVIAEFSRVKEARGQTKMQRNSLGELLLEKFWHYSWEFIHYEYGNHYIFMILDTHGLYHEAHVYMEEII
jgi:hypothetical protein